MRLSKTVALGVLAMLVALVIGCAEERDPIDRVQPYALQKSFFIGDDYHATTDDPEFWAQITVVDVGYGAGHSGLFPSTYTQELSRIRWQITEDMLMGRLSYERINSSDGKGAGGATQDGIIVCAYRIDKHFDIIKQYNATTGEEMNVIVEDSQDRPWFEREYVRVDWSKNLNTDAYDFDTLSMLGIYSGITWESLNYYVEDPYDREAPYFDFEGGYFDITGRVLAKPATIDISKFGWGLDVMPACWGDPDFMNGTAPAGTCNPAEVTIRTSFRRVVDTDFEPKEWDGFRFQAYGGFYEERMGYDRHYGMTDTQWHRLLNHFQIWERSHYYTNPEAMTGAVECYTPGTTPPGLDPNRDDDNDGTADECRAVGPGSQCDAFKQKCTLPLTQRKVLTIPWYTVEGSNLDYFWPSEDATHQWDVAFRSAVRTGRYAECVRTGGADCGTTYPVYTGQQTDNDDLIRLAAEVDDCRHGVAYKDLNRDPDKCRDLANSIGAQRGYSAGVISMARMEEILVLCHSPVYFDDPEICAPADRRLPEGWTADSCEEAWLVRDQASIDICKNAYSARQGDLRWHMLNLVDKPGTSTPWGISMNASDPLTGEVVSMSANVWTHVNDFYAQLTIDELRYAKGELSTEQITNGQYIKDWAAASEAATRGGVAPRMSHDDMMRGVSEFAGAEVELTEEALERFKTEQPGLVATAAKLKQQLKDIRFAIDAPSTMQGVYNARRKHAQGTEFEADLVTQALKEQRGVANLPMSDGMMDMVSPLRGGNPAIQRDLKLLKQHALSERGACILEMADAPLDVTGLAGIMEEKFGAFNPNDSLEIQYARAAKMRDYFARLMHKAVIVHEIGHCVGLRHNFVSSSDAWNYRPQYWQLRTKNGTIDTRCDEVSATGEECVGPRWFDPLTDEENDNMIWMWMQSSVMEYPGEITQDTLSLGAYDFAAARMFYGDVTSVYADPSYKVGTPRGETVLAKMDNFGGITGIAHQFNGEDIHYSELQRDFDMIIDCQDVADIQAFKPGRWDDNRDGAWHPTFDAWIVKVDGTYSRCRQQPVDYVLWRDLDWPDDYTLGDIYYRAGVSLDNQDRIRVPYGFATDRWADLGNLSVYRHDNGADAYEIFNYLITKNEVNHIFTNYRRNKMTFSVAGASGRSLSRYHTKLRDGAKGLGLYANIYRDFHLEVGVDYDTAWPYIASLFLSENVLASGMVFDHFTRVLARPENGPHYKDYAQGILVSNESAMSTPGPTEVIVPNGVMGKYNDILVGGRPIENQLASTKGEYDAEFTINCGSYYDKLSTAMLMTESVDNFISDSLQDFLDPRYRSVSMADLFPEGYRRWLANNLTDDEFIKGVRVAANGTGKPITDAEGYPEYGMGWTSWWGDDLRACFPADSTNVCWAYNQDDAPYGAGVPSNVAVVDPQVGWEQQKFLIAWTLQYLPENQQQWWLNMLRIWELGMDADPAFENRIEFHDPTGRVYVAKTYGKETLFGKTVQRGVSARVLEYANELMKKAYVTDDGPDIDGDGEPDWYIPYIDPTTGLPVVKWDASIGQIDPVTGANVDETVSGCGSNDYSGCTCTSNRACVALSRYVEIPFFLRQAISAYGLDDPDQKGIYR